MTSIDGVEYEQCRANAVYFDLEGPRVPVIALDDLKRNKGRLDDTRAG